MINPIVLLYEDCSNFCKMRGINFWVLSPDLDEPGEPSDHKLVCYAMSITQSKPGKDREQAIRKAVAVAKTYARQIGLSPQDLYTRYDGEFYDVGRPERIAGRILELESTIGPIEEKPVGKQRNREGYVYLLRSTTGYYKIGRTVNPDDRLTTFSVKLPFEVEYECVIQTHDRYGLEKALHTYYMDKRINGEWFALTVEDVAFIKGLAQS